jgi:hypothetical protein
MSEAHTSGVNDWPVPVHPRVAGVLMALAGSLLAFAALEPTPPHRTQAYVAWLVIVIGAMVVGGIGLSMGFRWAWPLAFVAALCAAGGGINAARTSEAWPIMLVVVALPSALMLWSLLAPGTREWLLRRERAHPRSEDEPWLRHS